MEFPTNKQLMQALCDRYEVKSPTTIVKRMKALGIKTSKNSEKFWLLEDQVALLDELNQHIIEGGRISDFVENHCSEITTTGTALTKAESEEVELTAEPVDVYMSNGSENQMKNLMAIAQQRATGVLVAERALTAQYLANPELLDDQLQEKISYWEEKCTPASIDPEDFARQLLKTYA